ncbi:hypothetical protein F4809DRAFT_666841 [Biscogniauxia mediterranea]|nr:hypothetical protein F4809DRAFT_666841 [Biscogniauxia mediterranea]
MPYSFPMATTISPNPHQISPLEKLMPRAYVRQIYCFPSASPAAIDVLRQGLAGTVSDVPYLLSGITTTGPGQMDVSLSEPYQHVEDLFSCHDLSSALDYAALRAGHFPPAALAIPGLFPPDVDRRPHPNPAPVFRARACPVRGGGLLLCVAVHHATTDITGFGALLRIWASHCRTGSSRAAGFEPSWLDRRALLLRPLDDDDDAAPPPFPPFLRALEPGETSRSRAGAPARPADYRTGIFFFAQEGLDALKRGANAHLSSSSSSSSAWVSTADVLSALLWSALAGASASPPVAALSAVAAAVRRAVAGVDAAGVRAHLAYLAYLDKAHSSPPVVILGAGHHGRGMSVVSWAGQGAREVDWGGALGGRCEAVRLPRMAHRRCPIVLPRVPAGAGDGEGAGLEVLVCFEEEYMERFARSWGVREYAVVRCMS